MIVSIHQPAYLPWLGYLDRISQSDLFIFLDTVQFEKNSFTNRNRIKTASGPVWLTVPVLSRGHLNGTLQTLAIDTRQNWQTKHLRSIAQAYAGAPDAKRKLTTLEAQYGETELLADLCHDQLLFWCAELGISTPIIRASTLNSTGTKSQLVRNLCKEVGATTYLSGPMGRDYLDQDQFQTDSIALEFHRFQHPTYHQLHGDFLPAMGVVDYWMAGEGAWVPHGTI